MVNSTLTYEQFNDEIYISDGLHLIGIIQLRDDGNCTLTIDEISTPFTGIEEVKRFIEYENRNNFC